MELVEYHVILKFHIYHSHSFARLQLGMHCYTEVNVGQQRNGKTKYMWPKRNIDVWIGVTRNTTTVPGCCSAGQGRIVHECIS